MVGAESDDVAACGKVRGERSKVEPGRDGDAAERSVSSEQR
jgi:hypothetical protein